MDRQDDPWYPQYPPEQAAENLWRPPGARPDPADGGDGDGHGHGDGDGDGENGYGTDDEGGYGEDGPDERGAPARPWVPRPSRPEAGPRPGSVPARVATRTRPGDRADAGTGEPRTPTVPRQGGAHAGHPGTSGTFTPGAGFVGHAGYGASGGRRHVNEDVDLDELDPRGRARHRAAVQAARRAHPNTRRRTVFRATAGVCAVLILAIAATGTYAYEHLFGEVATESLDSLTDRPAEAKADRFGNVPQNILVLGSQTRDGQHGKNLGNATKRGTDISDTAMLVHIDAERKWATVVSIPRDLVVPRPQCGGRLDPTLTVPSSPGAMFDLAMNLGGPTCAVATVEQMTGIRIDHFMEITFNAFQSLTDAVGGVTVCVPQPGINDPHYSGLVLGPGLHTVSGAESLAFVRDRHGLENGTDLNRIRMQQMFVSSLFNKLESAGTLGDPITLYRIANAVTSNLTVDTGLDSIDAMVDLAGSVQRLKSHYIQFLTVPYSFDPANQNRVIPGAGFGQVWADLRQDTPLPGSNAAEAFGTGSAPAAPSPAATATGPDPALSGVQVEVYNATQVPHLALYASENLEAMGVTATVGYSTKYAERYTDLPGTEVLYPSGEETRARALAARIGDTVTTLQSPNVSGLTLVVGPGAPAALTSPPAGEGAAPGAAASPGSQPAPAISAESRDGDQNICSDLPATVKYGGRP